MGTTGGSVVDYFLKIEGIEGESLDPQHKGAFEIKDFSFGVENPTTIGSATSGAGAGKAKFNEFTIKKTVDKASPLLFRSCASGAHIKEATFTARKAGERPVEFLKVRMSEVLISSFQTTGVTSPPNPNPVDVIAVTTNAGGSELPDDDFALAYRSVQVTDAQPTRVTVPPTAGGTLIFDPKTNEVTIGESNNGAFLVGTDGGRIARAVEEFDVGILIGLLTAPFSTAKLRLTVTEVRESAIDPGNTDTFAVNAVTTTKPHVLGVIMYAPADGVIDASDLTQHTRPGNLKPGTIHVDPNGPPATLTADLTDIVARHHVDTFGIRIQPRWAPLPDPFREDDGGDPDNPPDITPIAIADADD